MSCRAGASRGGGWEIQCDQALWAEGNWRLRCHHETSHIVHWVHIPSGRGCARPNRWQAWRRSWKHVLTRHRQANVWAMGRRPRNLLLPGCRGSGIPCRPEQQAPARKAWARRGWYPAGPPTPSPHEKDGPVPWEALATPRRSPVRRSAGNPSPTHNTSSGTRVVAPRGHRTRVRSEVGHRPGEPERWPTRAGSRRAAYERCRRGTASHAGPGRGTGGPC